MAVPKKPTVRALLGSVVVHALAAAALVRAPAAHPSETPDSAGLEVDLWSPPAPPTAVGETHEPSPEEGLSVASAKGSPHAGAASPEISRSSPVPLGEPQAPAPADSADRSRAWSFGQTVPLDMGDLGIGSYWKNLVGDRSLASPTAKGEAAPEQRSPPSPAEMQTRSGPP